MHSEAWVRVVPRVKWEWDQGHSQGIINIGCELSPGQDRPERNVYRVMTWFPGWERQRKRSSLFEQPWIGREAQWKERILGQPMWMMRLKEQVDAWLQRTSYVLLRLWDLVLSLMSLEFHDLGSALLSFQQTLLCAFTHAFILLRMSSFFSSFSSQLQCQHFLKLSLVSLPTASLFYSNSLLLYFICLLVDYIILLWLLCESMIAMRDLKFLEGKNSVLFFLYSCCSDRSHCFVFIF